MPESIEEYYARLVAAADAEARLPLDAAGIANWDVFPFEDEGLRLKPLQPLSPDEPPRHGEDPSDCWCARGPKTGDQVIWRNETWTLEAFASSGAPLVMLLTSNAHHDLVGLPDPLAAEMGRLMVAIGTAVEALPSVTRVHVSRWGDGSAHLHLFFFARPERMPQLRGTCLALWDDFLPRVPAEVISANARVVAEVVVGLFGGEAVAAPVT